MIKAQLPEGCMLLQSFCDKDHKQQQVLQEPAQSKGIMFRILWSKRNTVSLNNLSHMDVIVRHGIHTFVP
jgi:hypothetical protein